MPILIAEASGIHLDLNAPDRLHWFIGRSGECDISLDDAGISRYHATVFRVGEDFFVLDHSFNGTHICVPNELPGDASRVPSVASINFEANRRSRTSAQPTGNDTAEIDVSEVFAAEAAAAEQAQIEQSQPGGDAYDLHKSHAELRLQEIRSRLPRVAGYEPHLLACPEDLEPLLQMIYSAEEAQTLASMGRALSVDHQIVFVGEVQHYTTVIA